MSSGEERVRADWRILQSLKTEMQQALQLGKAQEGGSGLGTGQGGTSQLLIAGLEKEGFRFGNHNKVVQFDTVQCVLANIKAAKTTISKETESELTLMITLNELIGPFV